MSKPMHEVFYGRNPIEDLAAELGGIDRGTAKMLHEIEKRGGVTSQPSEDASFRSEASLDLASVEREAS